MPQRPTANDHTKPRRPHAFFSQTKDLRLKMLQIINKQFAVLLYSVILGDTSENERSPFTLIRSLLLFQPKICMGNI